MSNREDIPLILSQSCDYIDDEVYDCCIECYKYDTCEKAWMRRNLMKYSMDFKPRFMIALPNTKEDEKPTSVDLCFYNYSDHHDIRCYKKSGEEIAWEIVELILDIFYWGNANPTYKIKFEKNTEIGDVWVCKCTGPSNTACFIGYSEFSALHAVEDCENAKKLILDRYYKPKDSKPDYRE